MRKFDQSREIALFIEKLREYRNISQEEFLDDIVSMRQYRRYMNGDSTLSYVILDKLAIKLGFNAEFIIMELETEKIKQTQAVVNLYNAVATGNIDKSVELFMQINEKHLISENDRLLFSHAKYFFDYKKGQATELVTINRIKKLLGYDTIFNKKAFSTSELLILVSLFTFKTFKDIDLVAEKLAFYADNNITVVSGHNIRVISLVLEQLAKYFSIKENYEKMLYYATEGIKYSQSLRSLYLLDNLYFFAGAASHELNLLEKRDSYFASCWFALKVEGNPVKIARYRSNFDRLFDLDIEEIACEYVKRGWEKSQPLLFL